MKKGIVLSALLVILLFTIIFSVAIVPKLYAGTTTARTFAFVYNPTLATTYTTLYVVMVDESGNLVNATTGACTSSVTWANAVFTITAHAQSNECTIFIPALTDTKFYRMLLCADTANPGTPTKTDKRLYSMHYDPDYGTLYGEFAPNKLGIIPVKDMPVHLP